MITFQETILRLQTYWNQQGCALLQPIDLEVGAGTSHTATFLRAIGPEPWRAGYVQPSRRPKDARYGENPNRLHQHHQYQVVLKPSPPEIIELYLGSLTALGIDTKKNDIRFVEDNWENPTLGAWGLGWEVWMNGMEITQFTYFQQVGGLECKPITGEITYGLERLTMYLQNVDNVFDLVYTKWRDPGEEPKLHLFGQLKRVTREWLDNHLVCKGGTYPAQLMYQELADMACERITRGIVDIRALARSLSPLHTQR